MSEITLRFSEYQEIRDAMAFARGILEAHGIDPAITTPGFASLVDAGELLEDARWRTEEDRAAYRKGSTTMSDIASPK